MTGLHVAPSGNNFWRVYCDGCDYTEDAPERPHKILIPQSDPSNETAVRAKIRADGWRRAPLYDLCPRCVAAGAKVKRRSPLTLVSWVLDHSITTALIIGLLLAGGWLGVVWVTAN